MIAMELEEEPVEDGRDQGVPEGMASGGPRR
jgi:hypothetical protein